MRISRITIAAAAASIIAGGAGLAVANASTVQRSAASGTEHFSLMTTEPTTAKYVVIASGLFTAGGVDISGTNVDLVKLPGGTFKIDHNFPVKILKEQLNRQTCLAEFAGTSKFTVEKGTGAYKGLTGSGKAVIEATFIARRTRGACNPNATPLVSEETISATGHLGF
jgi:hypothetical protein